MEWLWKLFFGAEETFGSAMSTKPRMTVFKAGAVLVLCAFGVVAVAFLGVVGSTLAGDWFGLHTQSQATTHTSQSMEDSPGGVQIGGDNNGQITTNYSPTITAPVPKIKSSRAISLNVWDGSTYNQEYELAITGSISAIAISTQIEPRHGAVTNGGKVTIGNLEVEKSLSGKESTYTLVTVTFKTIKQIGASEPEFAIIP